MRRLVHRALLRCGYRIKRVDPVERAIRLYRLDHPEFALVQIGAYNGITGDPFCSFVLEDGWSAVLVEPQHRHCETLREVYANRRNVICREVAIGPRDGKATLYRVAEAPGLPHWAAQLATFNYEVIAGHRREIPDIERLIVAEEVECVTLPTLLAQCGVARFDLLATDAEGSDFAVIQQIDGLEFRPPLVYYEHKHLSVEDRAACEAFLAERGYRVAAVNADDSFAELGARR
jgi:FkbM family methyltransferase